jgi:sulfate adenylyltransferase
METIKPHGGQLVNRVKDFEKGELEGLEQVLLDYSNLLDLEQIGIGAYSPLEGFMTSDDYNSVVDKIRLSDYVPWSIPITLDVSKDQAKKLKEGDDIALVYGNSENDIHGLLHLEEKFTYDKKREAEQVYKTTEKTHPGVDRLLKQKKILLGGKISLVKRIENKDYPEYRLDPAETRQIFSDLGWRTVVGFQTRNPIHRAHEYLTKCALEMVDGLLIHPLIGVTKKDDISSKVRMRCYKTLIDHYYPQDRVLLGIFPAVMRYAGPREAIFHALVRKNYGCTHFTVGRDHAGVGNFYGTFDAQKIFYEFEACEIGIVPLFFEHVFYCNGCGHMASLKTCDHSQDERVFLSGTRVRDILNQKQLLPPEFARPEVAKILIEENGKHSTKKSLNVTKVEEEV